MKDHFKKILIAFVTVSFASVLGAADAFVSLDEYLSRESDSREPSYMFVRCGALHNAVSARLSATNPGQSELLEQLESSALMFVRFAGLTRTMQTNGDVNETSAAVLREMTRIYDIYNERLNNNYLLRGEVFGDDTLVKQDLATCGAILKQMQSGQSSQP
jgi:hypothetical protein